MKLKNRKEKDAKAKSPGAGPAMESKGWDALVHKSLAASGAGLSLCPVERSLSIPWASFGAADAVLRSLLDFRLNKSSRKAGGVVLGWGNVRLLANSGAIMDEQPVFHVHLVHDAVVFIAQPDTVHQAVIQQIQATVVRCILHEQISVSVFSAEGGYFPPDLQVGDLISFKVIKSNVKAKFYFVTAEFLDRIEKGSGKAAAFGESAGSLGKRTLDPFRLLDEFKKKGGASRIAGHLRLSQSSDALKEEEEETLDSADLAAITAAIPGLAPDEGKRRKRRRRTSSMREPDADDAAPTDADESQPEKPKKKKKKKKHKKEVDGHFDDLE